MSVIASSADPFNATAADYDAARRRLIPPFDPFYGTATEAVALVDGPVDRVLDLGAGTGLLSVWIAHAHPQARLTLLDGAPAMLEHARHRTWPTAPDYVVADLNDDLPPGPWDAIVSALSIHHLEHDAKRDLFARISEALRPGGVFVNAEQVSGSTAFLDDTYRRWLARRSAELGATDEEWRAALERMRADRCADVERQLTWMREAGLGDVDCLFRDHCFAVLAGRRPSTR